MEVYGQISIVTLGDSGSLQILIEGPEAGDAFEQLAFFPVTDIDGEQFGQTSVDRECIVLLILRF